MHIPLPIIRQTVNFREKIAGPIFYACYSMETETSVDGKILIPLTETKTEKLRKTETKLKRKKTVKNETGKYFAT